MSRSSEDRAGLAVVLAFALFFVFLGVVLITMQSTCPVATKLIGGAAVIGGIATSIWAFNKKPEVY